MYSIAPLLAATLGQVQRDPTVTGFLLGLVVGAALMWAWDQFLLAWLARMWAHHVRASRGR